MQLRRASAPPSPDIRLYLFHGPDEAAADAAASHLVRSLGDGIERVDLDAATLRKTPGRLADEAASLSLFGSRRVIRVTGIGDEAHEALSLLLAAGITGNIVIALAPSVRTTARIVGLAGGSPLALACAFYEPGEAETRQIVQTLARERGLTADAGVAARIAEAAGGNRGVIASEIEKLALLLDADADRPRALDHRALDAIGADLGDAAIDELVAAIIDGDPPALGQVLERLGSDGTSPVPWLRAVARRLVTLATMRAEVDGGEPVAAVMKRHRVFFREEAATMASVRRWSPAMLARAFARIRSVERATMAGRTAGTVLAEAAALTIARGIAARR